MLRRCHSTLPLLPHITATRRGHTATLAHWHKQETRPAWHGRNLVLITPRASHTLTPLYLGSHAGTMPATCRMQTRSQRASCRWAASRMRRKPS